MPRVSRRRDRRGEKQRILPVLLGITEKVWLDAVSLKVYGIAARKRYLGALQSSRGRGRGLRVGPEASLAERMEAFCSLLHEAEVGLREASRSGKLHDHCDGYFPLSNVAVKLASIVVLAMDVAVGEGVELGRAVLTYCAGEQT